MARNLEESTKVRLGGGGRRRGQGEARGRGFRRPGPPEPGRGGRRGGACGQPGRGGHGAAADRESPVGQ
eukprot:3219194-Pyramimonas_sp.AAC.1